MRNKLFLMLAVSVLCACSTQQSAFDKTAPDIAAPVLLSNPGNYDPLDYNTFPVYDVKHTIAPITVEQPQDKIALWRTKKATYLVMAYKQLWEMMYFKCSPSLFIRDRATQKEYHAQEAIGLPMDTTYWVKGVPGEWIAFVRVFPALPKSCTHIDIVGGKKPEHIPNTTGWSPPLLIEDVSIEELRANQDKMKFQETVIVE